MTHITEKKEVLRAAILERLQRMNDGSRSAESRSIVRRVLEMLPEDQTICAYVPMKTEPDIRPLIEEILKRGQPLFLPAFDGRILVMRRIVNLLDLVPGAFGIPEPPTASQSLDPKEPVTVLVPGRAFDQKGGRLGRGNGGYDRLISDHRTINSASKYYGVAFDCQLVTAVPMEAHDVFVDGVITGRGYEPAQK